jgi:hypothetical protein
MSISASLLAFGVRSVFDVSIDDVVRALEGWLTDHSQALPRALVKANDRAWQAVGLALAGDGLFERVKAVFLDGDLKGVRDQIKKFLDNTPTGVEAVRVPIRDRAAEEWQRLRKAKRLSAESVPLALVAQRAATMERYSALAELTLAAHRAVAETAAALRDEAPHLADLLTAAPAGGTPLLAAAFGFFFRREVETNPELAHGLTFGFLRQLTDRQERGFVELEVSLGAHFGPVVDRLDSLFDTLGNWFASANARLEEMNRKLDEIIQLRGVPTSTSDPLEVAGKRDRPPGPQPQTAPPTRRGRHVVVRHISGHLVVALIEIVSPSSKDRKQHVRDLAAKVVHSLEAGVHVLLLDLLPPGPHDPGGLHGAVWSSFDTDPYAPPADSPLTLVSYLWDGFEPEAYIELTAVGQTLLDRPLFLTPKRYLNVPLERTYTSAYRGMPQFWRDVLKRGPRAS